MNTGKVIERLAHIFASHLFLGELDLNERLNCTEELPPRPVFHTTILLDVFLNAPDCKVLDLNTYGEAVTTEIR